MCHSDRLKVADPGISMSMSGLVRKSDTLWTDWSGGGVPFISSLDSFNFTRTPVERVVRARECLSLSLSLCHDPKGPFKGLPCSLWPMQTDDILKP